LKVNPNHSFAYGDLMEGRLRL